MKLSVGASPGRKIVATGCGAPSFLVAVGLLWVVFRLLYESVAEGPFDPWGELLPHVVVSAVMLLGVLVTGVMATAMLGMLRYAGFLDGTMVAERPFFRKRWVDLATAEIDASYDPARGGVELLIARAPDRGVEVRLPVAQGPAVLPAAELTALADAIASRPARTAADQQALQVAHQLRLLVAGAYRPGSGGPAAGGPAPAAAPDEPLLWFDEARLTGALAELGTAARAAFAAACAQRMLPVYRWYHDRTGQGDPAVLEGALASLWAVLAGDEDESPQRLAAHLAAVEELVPSEAASSVEELAYAENATAAVACALRCWFTGAAQEAAWAASQPYEAVDYRVTNRDDPDLNSVGVRDRVHADPLIQRELARQRRDFYAVRHARPEAIRALAGQLRQRAQLDGQIVLDLPLGIHLR